MEDRSRKRGWLSPFASSDELRRDPAKAISTNTAPPNNVTNITNVASPTGNSPPSPKTPSLLFAGISSLSDDQPGLPSNSSPPSKLIPQSYAQGNRPLSDPSPMASPSGSHEHISISRQSSGLQTPTNGKSASPKTATPTHELLSRSAAASQVSLPHSPLISDEMMIIDPRWAGPKSGEITPSEKTSSPGRSSIVDLFRWKTPPSSVPHSRRASRTESRSRRGSLFNPRGSIFSLASRASRESLNTPTRTTPTLLTAKSEEGLIRHNSQLFGSGKKLKKGKSITNVYPTNMQRRALKKTSTMTSLTKLSGNDFDFILPPEQQANAPRPSLTRGPSMALRDMVGAFFSTSTPNVYASRHNADDAQPTSFAFDETSVEHARAASSDQARPHNNSSKGRPSSTIEEKQRPRTFYALEHVSSSLRNMVGLSVHTDVKQNLSPPRPQSHGKKSGDTSPTSPLSPLSEKSYTSVVPSLIPNNRVSSHFESSTIAPSLPSAGVTETPSAASASTEHTRSWWLVTSTHRTERVSMSADTVSSPQTPSMTPRTGHSAVSVSSIKRNTMDIPPTSREEYAKILGRDSKDYKGGLTPDGFDEPNKLKQSWLGRVGAVWRRSATSIDDLQGVADSSDLANSPDALTIMVCGPNDVSHVVNVSATDNAQAIRTRIFRAFEKVIPLEERGTFYLAKNTKDVWLSHSRSFSEGNGQPVLLDNDMLLQYVKEPPNAQSPFPSLALIRAKIPIQTRAPPRVAQSTSPTTAAPSVGLIERARRRFHDFFVGERPPMELLADQLLEYFPNIEVALNDNEEEEQRQDNGQEPDGRSGDATSDHAVSPTNDITDSSNAVVDVYRQATSSLPRSMDRLIFSATPPRTAMTALLSESPPRSVISTSSAAQEALDLANGKAHRYSFTGPSPAVSVRSAPSEGHPSPLSPNEPAGFDDTNPYVYAARNDKETAHRSDDGGSVRTHDSFTRGGTLTAKVASTRALSNVGNASQNIPEGTEVDAVSYIRNLVKQSTEVQAIHREATRRKSQAMLLSRRNSQMPRSESLINHFSVATAPRKIEHVEPETLIYAQSAPGNSFLSRTASLPYRPDTESPRIDIRRTQKPETAPRTYNHRYSTISIASDDNIEYRKKSVGASDPALFGSTPRSYRNRFAITDAASEEDDIASLGGRSVSDNQIISTSSSVGQIARSTSTSIIGSSSPLPASIAQAIEDAAIANGLTETKGAKAPFKWVKGKLIGEGSYGRVYHGLKLSLQRSNGQPNATEFIAIKQVDLAPPKGRETNANRVAFRKKMVEALQREMEFLKILDHGNIVRYYGFELTENTMNVFLEYVDGGTISSIISRLGVLPIEMIQSFTCQVLLGLEYLHNLDIIHRDIKGANVLVDSKGVVKISDFGISKRTGYSEAYRRASRMSVQGSVFWMAPEVVRSQGYSAKIDIWSTGCVVVEMISGHRPWRDYEEAAAFWQIGQYRTPPSPDTVQSDVRAFLDLAFTIDPEKRPKAAELLQHPFLDVDPYDVDFEGLYHQAELRRREEGSNNSELSSLASMDSDQSVRQNNSLPRALRKSSIETESLDESSTRKVTLERNKRDSIPAL
ncbi:hypothetical protein SmJEL517_g04885 [Synchytrium microbalum]|uniref:Protein kinase domain-containing protein n=1 Tax=Synchytrium microbalum TaxID=1806994 RepID=A0A507BPH2_9FUNG|nr:uncharacterized protein SmJEL517_g04885 [Synchytrium microbalum]TPX31870.1 hypothetical protein SmJEL517_g04885 [Synchytrium microbalum]